MKSKNLIVLVVFLSIIGVALTTINYNPVQASLNTATRIDLRSNIGGSNQVCSVYGTSIFGDLANPELWKFDMSSMEVDNGTTIIKPEALNSSEAGRWKFFYLLSKSNVPSFTSPSTATSITSGTAFQPNATTPCVVVINSTLAAGIVGLNTNILIQTCPTQNGTYITVSNDNLFIQVLNVANSRSSCTVPMAAGHWMKVTYTGSPTTGTATRWDLIG